MYVIITVALQEETSPVLLQHPEMCQSSGAAGVPVPHHAGQEVLLHLFPVTTVLIRHSGCFMTTSCLCVVCSQLCVEKCPDRYMTLVKAKLGKKEDHEYYTQYCKEGTNFTKLVNIQINRLLASK